MALNTFLEFTLSTAHLQFPDEFSSTPYHRDDSHFCSLHYRSLNHDVGTGLIDSGELLLHSRGQAVSKLSRACSGEIVRRFLC